MKKTLKVLALLACTAVLIISIASCNDGDKKPASGGNSNNASADGGNGGDAASAAPVEVEGETYDTGMFTVKVPTGWMLVPASDMFDSYDGDFDPTSVTLIKDGKEEWDTLDHAWARISLYDKDELMSSKEWYDDVKDMDPISFSGFDCTVYSGKSADYEYIIIEGASEKNDIAVAILTKNDQNSIDYNGNEMQTILRSIAVK